MKILIYIALIIVGLIGFGIFIGNVIAMGRGPDDAP